MPEFKAPSMQQQLQQRALEERMEQLAAEAVFGGEYLRGAKVEPKNILIMTVGLPRSGKSTWAREQGYPVVCPDSIRLALHGQRFAAEAEPMVWAIAKLMVRSLFLSGHTHVILDACSVSHNRRAEWSDGPWTRRYMVFDRNVEECREQAIREDRCDLLAVITRMHENMTKPTWDLWEGEDN